MRRRRIRVQWIRGWACRCRCYRVWRWPFTRRPHLRHVEIRLTLDTSKFRTAMRDAERALAESVAASARVRQPVWTTRPRT